MTITYKCECGIETQIEVSPFVPAKIHGPPENCHPAEGGDFDPEECQCGTKINEDRVAELASEEYHNRLALKAEHDEERRRERDWGMDL